MSKILDTLKDTYYKSADTLKDTYYSSVDKVKDTYYKNVDNIKTEYNNIISKYKTEVITLYFDVGICTIRLGDQSPEYKVLLDKYSSFLSRRENSKCISYVQSKLPNEMVQNLLLGKITSDIIAEVLNILSSDEGKQLCSDIQNDPLFSLENKAYFKAVTALNNYFPKDIIEQYSSILSNPENKNCITYILKKLPQSTINQLLIGNITLDVFTELITVLASDDANEPCSKIKSNPIFSKEYVDTFKNIISIVKNKIDNNEFSNNDFLLLSYIIVNFLNKIFPNTNIPVIMEIPSNLIDLIQQNKQQIIDLLFTNLNSYYSFFYGIYDKYKGTILSYAVLVPINIIDYLINVLNNIGTNETVINDKLIYGFSAKIISIYSTDPNFYTDKINDIVKQINQLTNNITKENIMAIITIIKNNSELLLNILTQIPQKYIDYVINILKYVKNIIKNSKSILSVPPNTSTSTSGGGGGGGGGGDTKIIQENIEKYSNTDNLDKKCKLVGEIYSVYKKFKNIKNIIKTISKTYTVDAIHIDPNNFSLEQIQQLGRAKQSYDSSMISSGQFNNIMSYNPQSPTLFISTIQSADVPADYKTNEKWYVNASSYESKHKINDYDVNCNALNKMTADEKNIFYNTLDSDIKTKYSITNDNLHTFCNKRELIKNKLLAEKIQGHGESHDKATSGYLERKTDYNIQIINIFNFSLGITLMLGAIYSYRF